MWRGCSLRSVPFTNFSFFISFSLSLISSPLFYDKTLIALICLFYVFVQIYVLLIGSSSVVCDLMKWNDFLHGMSDLFFRVFVSLSAIHSPNFINIPLLAVFISC